MRRHCRSDPNLYPGVSVGPGQPVAYPAWNTSQFYVSRANLDIRKRRGDRHANRGSRGVVGLNGDFSFAVPETSTGKCPSATARPTTRNSRPSYVFQNVANALNSTTNAAGQIVCAGTPVNGPTTTASSTCAPLNIFGNGSPSLAAQQYVTHLAEVDSFNTQRDTNAFIAGDILKVPAGEWKFSAGFENRRESADFTPDSFYTEDLGQSNDRSRRGLVSSPTRPISRPCSRSSRRCRTSQDWIAWSWKGPRGASITPLPAMPRPTPTALRWSPIEDVQFRGNKTKSIRAPSITELFLPSATVDFSSPTILAIRTSWARAPVPATREANCARRRLRATTQQTFTSNVVNATCPRHDLGQHGSAERSGLLQDLRCQCCVRDSCRNSIFRWTTSISALKEAIESLTLDG